MLGAASRGVQIISTPSGEWYLSLVSSAARMPKASGPKNSAAHPKGLHAGGLDGASREEGLDGMR